MRPYRLVTPAYRDLREILEYLALHSTQAPGRFLLGLDARLRTLAKFPYSGFRRNHLGHPQLCFITFDSNLIAFDPVTNPLVILAIRHSARNPETLLEGI